MPNPNKDTKYIEKLRHNIQHYVYLWDLKERAFLAGISIAAIVYLILLPILGLGVVIWAILKIT